MRDCPVIRSRHTRARWVCFAVAMLIGFASGAWWWIQEPTGEIEAETCPVTEEGAAADDEVETYFVIGGVRVTEPPKEASRLDGEWQAGSGVESVSLRLRKGVGVLRAQPTGEVFDVVVYRMRGSRARVAVHSRSGDAAFHWMTVHDGADQLKVTRVSEFGVPISRYVDYARLQRQSLIKCHFRSILLRPKLPSFGMEAKAST